MTIVHDLFSKGSGAYMRGEYCTLAGTIGTTNNTVYEINSMQKLFHCLRSQRGITYDIEDAVDQ